MEAIHRTRGRAIRHATPIRLVSLLSALDRASVSPWSPSAAADITCMLLAHHCLLRSKELLAARWSDFSVTSGGTVELSVSPAADKTNRRHTARRIVLPPSEDSPLLARLALLRAASDSEFVCGKWRSYSRWSAAISTAATACGWPPGVSSHSFRAGGATDLLEGGVPPEEVRRLGRWSSDAFLMYWRPSPAETAEHVGSALRLASWGPGARRASLFASRLNRARRRQ